MPLNSKLSKLLAATQELHHAKDDPDDPGSKVHCMVKGKLVQEEHPWAILNNCLFKHCTGCIVARPTDIEELCQSLTPYKTGSTTYYLK